MGIPFESGLAGCYKGIFFNAKDWTHTFKSLPLSLLFRVLMYKEYTSSSTVNQVDRPGLREEGCEKERAQTECCGIQQTYKSHQVKLKGLLLVGAKPRFFTWSLLNSGMASQHSLLILLGEQALSPSQVVGSLSLEALDSLLLHMVFTPDLMRI